MPQMAPLNWLSLMMFFITILILFNSVNFYSFMYKPYTKTMENEHKSVNWKW